MDPTDQCTKMQDMTKRRLLTPGKWTRLSFDRTRMTGRRMAAGSRLLVVVDVLRGPGQQVNYGTGRDVRPWTS
jgi:hypothetical protein